MTRSTGSPTTHQGADTEASGPANRVSILEQTHWIPSGAARCGDEFVDFSCHEVVRITPQTPTSTWRDDTFFFCSSFCRQRFVRAPDEFLK
ncbi:MAG: hypothetical protein GTO41_23655 [Burkholderiales bacterium]|nr:hypothetical protein [Burkholderiales bacterium]